jgi:hypothetical protein
MLRTDNCNKLTDNFAGKCYYEVNKEVIRIQNFDAYNMHLVQFIIYFNKRTINIYFIYRKQR